MTAVIFRRKGLGLSSCRGIAEKMSNPVEVITNNKDQQSTEASTLIRWGCTARYGSTSTHTRTVNKARAISISSDKGSFRVKMSDRNIAPMSSRSLPALSTVIRTLADGVIIRPGKHAQGCRLYHETDLRSAKRRFSRLRDAYWSEFIPKVKEYRVFLADKGVLCVVEKVPEDPSQLAWNHARGAEIPNVRWSQWPLGAIKVAEEARKLAGLDFCGADVIEDEEGVFYVLELNSAPTLSHYRQEKFAKMFDYVIDSPNRSPVEFSTGQDLESWEQCIHPAVMRKPETIPQRGY